MDFVNPAYETAINQSQRNPFLAVETLFDVVRSGALVKTRAWCYRHRRQCRCYGTDAHVAGTPCTPLSTQGSQKANEDPCVLFLLVWCALMNKLRIPAILQENVSGFTLALLVSLMGHAYNIQYYVCDTPEYGWPGLRVRKYHGITLKDATMPASVPADPMSLFTR